MTSATFDTIRKIPLNRVNALEYLATITVDALRNSPAAIADPDGKVTNLIPNLFEQDLKILRAKLLKELEENGHIKFATVEAFRPGIPAEVIARLAGKSNGELSEADFKRVGGPQVLLFQHFIEAPFTQLLIKQENKEYPEACEHFLVNIANMHMLQSMMGHYARSYEPNKQMSDTDAQIQKLVAEHGVSAAVASDFLEAHEIREPVTIGYMAVLMIYTICYENGIDPDSEVLDEAIEAATQELLDRRWDAIPFDTKEKIYARGAKKDDYKLSFKPEAEEDKDQRPLPVIMNCIRERVDMTFPINEFAGRILKHFRAKLSRVDREEFNEAYNGMIELVAKELGKDPEMILGRGIS